MGLEEDRKVETDLSDLCDADRICACGGAMMIPVEIIIVAGGLWVALLLVDYASFNRRGPAAVQMVGKKLASSFPLSFVIHIGLFCIGYGTLAYYAISITPLHTVEVAICWIGGGLFVVVAMVEALRTMADDTWLLRRWVLEDLKKAERPQAHVESLVVRIKENPEDPSSKKALYVLREIARRGDSTASMTLSILERNGLL